jgi:4-amino-4-deoxy-L-arabinose transferase-like glycosyltransferase
MRPYRLLTAAVFAAATLPRLAHRGMFVDGVTYAAVARNLAIGRGSFWNPSYTSTVYPIFHEHPPLGFWLQSLWFRVMGDHLWVERAYSLIAALLTAVLIAAFWRRLCKGGVLRETAGPDDTVHRAGAQPAMAPHRLVITNAPGLEADASPIGELEWLPVLLWIIVPVVSWAIAGNLLETTVAIFTTAAVLSAWRAVDTDDAHRTAWSAVSGLCIVAAVLTKGPVGFFPLVVPLAAPLAFDPARALRSVLVQWGTVAACILLLWLVAPARASLTDYLNQQVIAALSGAREVGRPLTIVKTLVFGVLVPEASALALLIVIVRRVPAPSGAAFRRVLILFTIGLAGSLPILASSKQAGHYLVPAIPCFALAGAVLGAPNVAAAVAWIRAARKQSLVHTVAAVLALGTLAASLYPGAGRDRVRLAEIDRIAGRMPRDETIGLCPASNADWGLHAWFERLFRVSLDATGQTRAWFLWTADINGCVPESCDRPGDPHAPLELVRCRTSDRTPVR